VAGPPPVPLICLLIAEALFFAVALVSCHASKIINSLTYNFHYFKYTF